MFDLNQLRCFVAVAEELHFGRAAQRLNMTQPPLSRQIQVLERILDVRLLDRTSRSVKLSLAGRSFLPEARRLMKMAEAAAQLAKRVDSGKVGSIRIGFTAASAYSYLPGLMANAVEAMPEVDFALSEMVTKDQIDALLNGQADIGLMRPPITRPDLASMRVLAEGLVAAIPENSPLASADSISVDDFSGQPFIMYAANEARYFHDIVVSIFSNEKVLPKYVQHLAQIHTILALVKSGLGCALVPESARNLRYDGVVMKPMVLQNPRPIELFMVWRKDNDNPMVDRLLEVIEDSSRAA